jgi:putative oxidoreductase
MPDLQAAWEFHIPLFAAILVAKKAKWTFYTAQGNSMRGRKKSMKRQTFAQFAALPLRIVLGVIFLIHGIMKFAQMTKIVLFFSTVGIPLSSIVAPGVALLEIVGGIGLILGFATSILALLLAIDMIVAIVVVKLKLGLVGGYEFELALLAGLLSLSLSGPGKLSLLRSKPSPNAYEGKTT